MVGRFYVVMQKRVSIQIVVTLAMLAARRTRNANCSKIQSAIRNNRTRETIDTDP